MHCRIELPNAQDCDATDDDNSTAAGYTKTGLKIDINHRINC